MSSSISTCQICNQVPFKYCCPKCNILYCSVACYKSATHLQCSEQFYRKCVEDELAASASSIRDAGGSSNGGSNFNPYEMNEGIRKMHEILQRVNNEDDTINPYDFEMDTEFENYMYDYNNGGGNGCEREQEGSIDSDDEDDDDLAKRLEGVNIDDPDAIWDRLTNAEKYEFEKLIQTGEITKMLPACQVWWEIQEDPTLIEDITENSNKNNDIGAAVLSYPEILGDILPFNAITQKQPSPCVIHNITNILAAYAYMVRYFNGEHRQTPQESVNCLVTLSAALKSNANFDNGEQALKSVIYEGQVEGLGLSDEEFDMIREDVRKMFEGRFKGRTETLYILSALSDIHRLLTVAKLTKSLKQSKIKFNIDDNNENNCNNFTGKFQSPNYSKTSLFMELDRRKLNQLIKKIEYCLSYINSNNTN